MPRRLAQQGETEIAVEDFKLESVTLMAEGPTVEKLQLAQFAAYARGVRQGYKESMAALEAAFKQETEETK